MGKPDSLKEKAFHACLEVIKKEGWTKFSFQKASEISNIPLDIFYSHFPRPSEVMVYLFQKIDEQVLNSLGSLEDLSLSPKDALFEVLMARFEAAEAYKPTLRIFWREWIHSPEDAPALTCQGYSSMAWMLEAANLKSRGLKGLLQTQGLLVLYLLTLRTWLEDDTQDMGQTMVFLDKNLTRLERFAPFLEMI